MEVPTQFHFTHRRMVEFSDTDLAGIVHFSNFFRYVESAEHAFFRSLGHSVHTTTGGAHQGWPRIDVACKYHKPARFEQTLEIGLRLRELRNSSLRYEFWILGEDRSLLATGALSIIHVEIEASGKIAKAPIPPALRDKLAALLPA